MPATALIKLLGLANESYCKDHFPWTTDLHIFPGTNALLVSFLDSFPRMAEYKNHKRFILLNIGNFSLKVCIFLSVEIKLHNPKICQCILRDDLCATLLYQGPYQNGSCKDPTIVEGVGVACVAERLQLK